MTALEQLDQFIVTSDLAFEDVVAWEEFIQRDPDRALALLESIRFFYDGPLAETFYEAVHLAVAELYGLSSGWAVAWESNDMDDDIVVRNARRAELFRYNFGRGLGQSERKEVERIDRAMAFLDSANDLKINVHKMYREILRGRVLEPRV